MNAATDGHVGTRFDRSVPVAADELNRAQKSDQHRCQRQDKQQKAHIDRGTGLPGIMVNHAGENHDQNGADDERLPEMVADDMLKNVHWGWSP